MLKINSVLTKTPSTMTWELMDLSSEDSGRTLDGLMHKDVVAQKIKLSCVWNNLDRATTSSILKAVNSSIFLDITYPDAMAGMDVTKKFYVGDRSAPFKMWTVGTKVFSSVSFEFIER